MGWRGARLRRGPPAFVGDGSILVVRLFGGLTNSDAFFAFSDMRVRFGQVRCGAGMTGKAATCDHRPQVDDAHRALAD
jgi:hypothetical protein